MTSRVVRPLPRRPIRTISSTPMVRFCYSFHHCKYPNYALIHSPLCTIMVQSPVPLYRWPGRARLDDRGPTRVHGRPRHLPRHILLLHPRTQHLTRQPSRDYRTRSRTERNGCCLLPCVPRQIQLLRPSPSAVHPGRDQRDEVCDDFTWRSWRVVAE